jgi:hypothetical protein
MLLYKIIETDEGLAVAEMHPGVSPDEVAAARGGMLVDPGPYRTFEDAYDALVALQTDEEEDEEPA